MDQVRDSISRLEVYASALDDMTAKTRQIAAKAGLTHGFTRLSDAGPGCLVKLTAPAPASRRTKDRRLRLLRETRPHSKSAMRRP
jgi:hypothetical protein